MRHHIACHSDNMRPLNMFTKVVTEPMHYSNSNNYDMMDLKSEKECLKIQYDHPPNCDDFEIVYEHSKRFDK